VKRLAWIGLCLLAAGAGCAMAQERSVSYSTWIVAGNMVTLRYLLPVSVAQRLMGVEVSVLTAEKLGDYLLQHQTVGSAGGECPAIDQGFDLGRVDPLAVGADLYGFEIFYRCTDPRHLLLRNTAVFDAAPGHVDFARIQMNGRSIAQLFTAQHQQLALPDAGTVAPAAFAAYLRLGLRHVLTSTDRWIFLLGALLLVRRRQDVGYLIAAVASGYLLSVLVASTGWMLPRMPRMEAFMGLLVVLLGATIMQRELRSHPGTRPLWPAILLLLVVLVALVRAPSAALALLGGAALSAGFLSWQSPWPCLVAMFAFLDGFALPAVLGPAQLPQRTQTQILMGFDLGAMLIALLLIGLACGAWQLLRAARVIAPRAIVNDLCAATLCGLGSFWLLTGLA
jgi:HupE / UreJ protein